jgi:hypothetical protein
VWAAAVLALVALSLSASPAAASSRATPAFLAASAATTTASPWTSIASMPAARAEAGAVSVKGGTIYVVGGVNGQGTATKTLYAYNVASNTWSVKAPALNSLIRPQVVASNGQVFVLGSQNLPTVALRYTPSTNTWAPFGAPVDGRTGFVTGVGASGRIYAIGGNLPGEDSYDPVTKTWYYEGSTLADTSVSIADQANLAFAVSYDPSANTFATLPYMPMTWDGTPGLRTGPDGRAYAIGNEFGENGDTNTTQIWNPATKTWGVAAGMPYYADEPATAVTGGRIFSFGGWDSLLGSDVVRSAAAFRPGDTTAPTMSGTVAVSFAQTDYFGDAFGIAEGAPLELAWSHASDASGISGYFIQHSANGKPYGAVQIYPGYYWGYGWAFSDTSGSAQFVWGKTQRFRAGADDNYANPSAWRQSPAMTPTLYEETSPAISYAGTWTVAPSPNDASGGQITSTTQAGASASFTFTGRGVGFAAPANAAGFGAADVYIDGAKVATVDESTTGDAYESEVIWQQQWSSVGTHTIKLVVRPHTADPTAHFDLDAFVTLQ